MRYHAGDFFSAFAVVQGRMILFVTPVEDLVDVRGVPVSSDISFRHLVVTGPPGCGKTALVETLRGWPEEGYLDLTTRNWWRSRLLTFRPREVHFGLPFRDHAESHAVFDQEWLDNPTPVDVDRIVLPPRKSGFLTRDWRSRYVFEFLLPSPEDIFDARSRRVRRGTHPVDQALSLETIRAQHQAYQTVAVHFHRHGMKVFVRTTFGGAPQQIVDSERSAV